MKTISGGKSIQGARPYQQDAFARTSIDDMTILAMADGNGGPGGEKIAEISISASISWLLMELASGKYKDIMEDELRGLGLGAVKEAGRQTLDIKKVNPDWASAGSTLTLVLLNKDLLGVFWVGDSPCYMFNSGTIELMNAPLHTLAEKLIQEGHSRESIKNQPSLNSTLIRCLGYEQCEPDENIIKLSSPALVIAGSDGALDYVSEEEVVEIIKSQFSTCFDIQKFSEAIVQKAFENKSDDNITVVSTMALPDLKLTKTTRRTTRLINTEE